MKAIPKQRISALSYLGSLWRGRPDDETRFLGGVRTALGDEGLHCIPIGRARTGIYLLVKHAVRPGRSTVLLSPCTIPDVVNMVKLAGGTPVFVDYVPRSTNVDLDRFADRLGPDVACVIATHYHVNQAALPAMRALCRDAGVLLFEDCAISFGGTTEGRPIGGQTDASVFSFSAFKFLNFFWGGLITTRDAALAQAIRTEIAGWKRLAHADYIRNSKNISIYYFFTRPLIFQVFTFPRLQRRARASAASAELPYERIEHKELDDTLCSTPSFAAFAQWRAKLGPVREQIAHRRAIAALYRRRLGMLMIGAETGEAGVEGACFVNFPIWVEAGARDAVHRDAMIAGFDLGKSLYPNVHDIEAFASCEGCSDNARALVASTLYLPTHLGVTPAYASRLAEVIADLLVRHGAAGPLKAGRPVSPERERAPVEHGLVTPG